MASLFHWVSINPGGVPFGYFTQQLFLHLFGFSPLVSRSPSILFSIMSCVAIHRLGTVLGLKPRAAMLGALIFALLPLQVRYATEARPYSEALFFGIVSTIMFLRLLKAPSAWNTLLYTVSIAAGLYTQPFSLFIPASHVVCGLAHLRKPGQPRAIACAAVAIAASLAVFAPWFVFVHSQWTTSIKASGYAFKFDVKTFSMLFREVSGSYILTILLLGSMALRLSRRTERERTDRTLLIAMIVLPIICTLIADSAAGYFFAVRQIVFILPAIAILAADGISTFWSMGREKAGAAATLVLIAACVIQDARMLARPREDWAKAAARIRQITDSGACLITVPQEWQPLYSFFQPEIGRRACVEHNALRDRIIVASTPYTDGARYISEQAHLGAQRFEPAGSPETVGGTKIQLFHRIEYGPALRPSRIRH